MAGNKLMAILILIFFPVSAAAQHDHLSIPGHHTDDGRTKEPHGQNAFYGNYPHQRESSGTSWQPESSPVEGRYFNFHGFDIMLHGYAFGIYDWQGGPRGSDKFFSSSMFMLMANKKLSIGTLGYRSMLSLDPLMGRRGYPLLFQTGESYDGIHHLVDQQHPHDFFMEEALTYSFSLSEENSLFAYFGLPGEPALGPPAFMHRFSAMDNPEAPLGHHWLDSTHITYGVITLGCVFDNLKLEGSVFRGREPNEERWDMESPKFDSYSTRLSFNPNKDMSFQVSYGYLDSPEQLESYVDINRITASLMFNRDLSIGQWQTTFAWGSNYKRPGLDTNAFLLESALRFNNPHTIFGRFEYTEKDELFDEDHAAAGKDYDIKKFTLGYIYDLPWIKLVRLSLGATYSVHFIPMSLEKYYSDTPQSCTIFTRIKF